MFYLVKSSWLMKRLFPDRVWEINTDRKAMYLSFDDGPHPVITGNILDILKSHHAKATFFCIGKNVQAHPEVYRRIIEEGHSVGNHTQDHLNGWKTPDAVYLENIEQAKRYIDSPFFRPPYGRISSFQQKQLAKERFKLTTVMWSVLSGDFDQSITPQKCLDNVLLNAKAGSIVVFHDSEKAATNVEFALPEVLKYFTAKGFVFEAITPGVLQKRWAWVETLARF
ncbi:MAG: polysaccharide deacetylase family protein [Chryseobacterium sp.]|nr:MAG: polysaccharide deacetylase family protein [Chryseobacterium sp.]